MAERAAARGREQPRLRPLRHAVARPRLQRRDQCVTGRVRRRHVAPADGEPGDEPAVRPSAPPSRPRRGLPARHRSHREVGGSRRPRRSRPRGSVPPTRAPCRGPALQSRGSRRAAPSSRRHTTLAVYQRGGPQTGTVQHTRGWSADRDDLEGDDRCPGDPRLAAGQGLPILHAVPRARHWRANT